MSVCVYTYMYICIYVNMCVCVCVYLFLNRVHPNPHTHIYLTNYLCMYVFTARGGGRGVDGCDRRAACAGRRPALQVRTIYYY